MVKTHLGIISDNGLLDGILEHHIDNPTRGALILHPHPLYGGDLNNTVVLALNVLLLNMDYATLRFNFTGGSGSRSLHSGLTGSLHEAEIVLDFLKQKTKLENVGVLGYSFGGSVALGLASHHDLSFLVTLSASLSLVQQLGDIQSRLTNISCPTLMIHGSSDKVVPFSDMKEISLEIESNQVITKRLDNDGHFYNQSLGSALDMIHEFLLRI